jgi:hypothetical protein
MPVRVPAEPKPLGDATAYARLPWRSLYHRPVVEQHNHLWGLRGRVLVPVQLLTGQRELGPLRSVHVTYGTHWTTRSDKGRGVTFLISVVASVVPTVEQLYCKPTFSNWDGTSADAHSEQVTDMVLAPPPDDDPLGLSAPGDITALSRLYMGASGDRARPGWAAFRFLPNSAIDAETKIVMELRALAPPQAIQSVVVTGYSIIEEPITGQ